MASVLDRLRSQTKKYMAEYDMDRARITALTQSVIGALSDHNEALEARVVELEDELKVLKAKRGLPESA